LNRVSVGLVGGLLSGRPILLSAILAFAVTALAAYEIRKAGYAASPDGMIAAGAVSMSIIVTAAIGALAPLGQIGRLVFALSAIAAGVFLTQTNFVPDNELFRAAIATMQRLGAPLCFVIALLGLGARLWRTELRLSLIGFFGSGLALLSGVFLSAYAPEQSMAGRDVILAACFGFVAWVAALFRFTQSYAVQPGAQISAGIAARDAWPAVLLGIALLVMFVFLNGELAAITVLDRLPQILPVVAGYWFGCAALSLAPASEKIATMENLRFEMLGTSLMRLRGVLSPANSIAFVLIAAITSVVAAFENPDILIARELLFCVAVAVVAGLLYLSIRAAIFLGILLVLLLLVGGASASFFGLMPAAPADRLAVISLAALNFAQMALVWRLERHPRRNAVQVAQRATSLYMPVYFLTAILTATLLLGAQMTGLWLAAGPSLVYFLYIAFLGAVLTPPFMVALGAAFGREL
jgi:hypothetical protein